MQLQKDKSIFFTALSYTLIVLLGSLTPSKTIAQEVNTSFSSDYTLTTIEDIYSKIYNFQFNQAELKIKQVKHNLPASLHNLIRAQYLRWKHIPIHELTEENEIAQDYLNHLNNCINQHSEKLNNNQQHLISTQAYFLLAEYHYNKGNKLKAFQAASNGYSNIKEILDSPDDDQAECNIIKGLYNYYYEYYANQSLVNKASLFLFKEGNKEDGLSFLNLALEDSQISKTESLIYLSHIYLRMENKPKVALSYAKMLHQIHPDNLKFLEYLLEAQLSTNTVTERSKVLIDKYLTSSSPYFQNYGKTYHLLFKSASKEFDSTVLAQQIVQQIAHLQSQQTSNNHLISLLYKRLYEITLNSAYLEELKNSRVYKYKLTIIEDTHTENN